jgi:hypothetical protein
MARRFVQQPTDHRRRHAARHPVRAPAASVARADLRELVVTVYERMRHSPHRVPSTALCVRARELALEFGVGTSGPWTSYQGLFRAVVDVLDTLD